MEIASSTRVTFSGGSLMGTSKILLFGPFLLSTNHMFLIAEETPFHPLDYNWPDQPGDRGWATIQNKRYPIVDSLTAAFNTHTEEFLLDQEIKNKKIRRNDPDWFFLVAHILDGTSIDATRSWKRESVSFEVDSSYREKLSKAHTASHLASLALNKVTKEFWGKTPDNLDALGHPNLDGEAILQSKISSESSIDHFRCGKSLRKQGFNDSVFFSEPVFQQVETDINKQLQEWCSDPNGIQMTMTPSTAFLQEKREWICVLPDGKRAVIACGGTHAPSLFPPNKIVVCLTRECPSEFTMVSRWIENA